MNLFEKVLLLVICIIWAILATWIIEKLPKTKWLIYILGSVVGSVAFNFIFTK